MLLVALWASVVGLNVVNHRNALSNLAHQTEIQALALAEHVEATIKLADYAVLDLRDDWLEGPKPFANALARHHALLTELKSHTTVLDTHGMVVYTDRPGETVGTPAGDRAFFKTHQAGNADALRVDTHFCLGNARAARSRCRALCRQTGALRGCWCCRLTRLTSHGFSTT